MNKVYVIGMGPGAYEQMTVAAVEALKSCDVIVGYTVYVDLMKKYFPEKEFMTTPMRKEPERCRLAFEEAKKGRVTAMVCSGDSGIYGMAGLMYEIGEEYPEVEVECVPGVTAAIGGASVLGAPLIHDFAVISLSDCMTPLELIWRRVSLAAEADFVICLYNPKSRSRTEYLAQAAVLIGQHRSPDTPVGIVRNAGRAEEKAWITTLKKLPEEPVDMFCVVLIGNSQTYVQNGKMITPRGYCIHPETQA